MIIAAIVLFIVFLFILFRIILKKGLKLSLFDSSIGTVEIQAERNVNIGKYSNPGVTYKANLNTRPKKTSLGKKKNKKPKNPKKINSKKKDNTAVLINNTLKKVEPKENAVNLSNKESINKSVKGNKDSLGLKVNSFEDIYKFLGNSGTSDIVRYFEANNIELINLRDNEKRISSSAEFEDSIKNKIIDFLNNQYGDLRDKISDLRKSGKDMNDAEFMLLSVPLKIKLLSANFSKKDFDLVIKKIDLIKEILKDYK